MNNSFMIKGIICRAKNQKELDLREGAFAVCIDGLSRGVSDRLESEE